MTNRNEKLKEIFSDEAKVKEVLSIEDPEKAREWFSEHGVEFSIDEIHRLGETINKISRGEITQEDLNKSDELSEDDLEDVAGGSEADMFLAYLGVVGVLGIAAIAIPW